MKRYRTICLSDTHLGSRALKAGLLASFIRGHSADRWFFVGDIVDCLEMKRSWYWPAEHSELLRQMLKLSRDADVTYIAGNHDAAVRQFVPVRFGEIGVCNQAVHHGADGRRLLVVHGDMFDNFVTTSRISSVVGAVAYDTLLAANTLGARALAAMGRDYWSLAAYVRSAVPGAKGAVQRFEAAVCDHARRKGYDGVVCGHIHQAAVHQHSDVLYLNCGDWVESCTALAEDHEGRWRLVNWAAESRQR